MAKRKYNNKNNNRSYSDKQNNTSVNAQNPKESGKQISDNKAENAEYIKFSEEKICLILQEVKEEIEKEQEEKKKQEIAKENERRRNYDREKKERYGCDFYEDSILRQKRHKSELENEKEYRDTIGCWLKTVSFLEFCKEIEKRVIGQEEVKRVCYNIYHYLELIAKGSRKSLPFILAAPSGCGKSETYRAVKDYFNKELHFLSCIYVDASELTEAGYKGNNPETVVNGLLERPNSNGIGIVFLDEMDKKMIPSYNSMGQNVNAAVQHGLLTIIEGREVTATHNSDVRVNTNNTLFIAMGAFDFVRASKEEEKYISLGETKGKRDHFDGITREEMLEAGAGNELVGRFQSIINYHRLTEESVRKIVDLNVKELSEEFDINIFVRDDVYSAMYAVSNGKFGCRLLKSILRERVQAMDMKRKLCGKSAPPVAFILNGDGDCCLEYEDVC